MGLQFLGSSSGSGGSGVTDRGSWAATTAYAKGDRYTGPDGLRRDVTTAYTSGASFGSTDTTNTAVAGSATVGVTSQAVQGLGPGGFRRVQSAAIADLSASSKGVRNPRGYWEAGTHYIVTDTPASTGDVSNAADLGLWTGPSLTSLTYQGTTIAASTLSAQFSGGLDYVAGSSILKDSGGTYHEYVCATDGYVTGTLPNIGAIYHYTASAPTGPWTLQGQAIAPSSDVPTDNCAPVYYNGAWYMCFMSYPAAAGGSGRTLALATASSLNGPWTRLTAPTQTFGGPLDGPQLFVDGDRLLLFAQTQIPAYTVFLSDLSDLTTMTFWGSVLQTDATNPREGGSSSWGGGSFYKGDGEVWAVWQGISGGGSYYKAFGGRWVPGAIYVPVNGNYFVSNATFAAGGTTFSLPASLPPEAYAVDLAIDVWEPGTYTPGEFVRVSSASVGAGPSVQLWPQAAAQGVSGRFRIDVQTTRQVRATSSGAGAPRINMTLAGYWRLP